jgi:hypothetical protein
VITPAVDRLSRDTDRSSDYRAEMQRAGAGIRSLSDDRSVDFAIGQSVANAS